MSREMTQAEATGSGAAGRAAADRDTAPAAIAPARARSLHRWNVALAVLHALQGLAILAISFAKNPLVTAPVVSSYLAFDTATKTLVPAQRTLFDLPIGPAVALFFFLSAVAHLSGRLPGPPLVRAQPRARPEPGPLDRVRALVERDDRRHRDALGDPGDRDAGRDLRRSTRR